MLICMDLVCKRYFFCSFICEAALRERIQRLAFMYLVFTGFLLALPISVVEQTFNQIDHILSMSMLFL